MALDNIVKTTLGLDILGRLQEHLRNLAVQHQLDFLVIVDPKGYFGLSQLSVNIADIDLAQMYTYGMEQGMCYDAVIMDLTIPGGMGGVKEAVALLVEVDPTARVIVFSGYSSHEVMADYKKYGFAGIVIKPFRISDLGRVLKE